MQLAFAYTNSRLCIAHLTHQTMPAFDPVFIPFILGAANAHFGLGLPSFRLWQLALVVSIATYVNFIVRVIRDMCTVKGVYLFRIPYKKNV